MPSPVFEFDRFKLDIAAYELRRANRTVRLQRVPMDLLILLVERRGALVTREEIASRVWNGDLFVDTQGSINTAIRKVRQALGDDVEKPRFIETVVGKGYRFIGEFSVKTQTEEIPIAAPRAPAIQMEIPAPLVESGTTVVPAKPGGSKFILFGIVCVLAIGVIAALTATRTRHTAKPPIIAPFSAAPGSLSWPAFSPDGDRVAFSWTGGSGNCSHIYVQEIDAASPTQLTDEQTCDDAPSWSRNGRSIAFLRKKTSGQVALYVVPALGGTAREISTLNGPSKYRPAWTPDGKALVVMDAEPAQAPPSLFRIALDAAEKRHLTQAQSASTGDWCPAYSPNGRLLAYLHNTGSRRLSSIYVVPVDASGVPAEEPRKVETGLIGFSSFDWSADGRSFIGTTPSGLVRVSISNGDVKPLPFPDGSEPAVAPRGDRVVYLQLLRDSDIFRVAGPGYSGPVTSLISSTLEEYAPQYSPEGKRIVLVSDRSGSEEIWVTDSNGHAPRRLTSFQDVPAGSPRWSWDGKWVAFDSPAGGQAGIYIVSDEGGEPRRITSPRVSCIRPSWSHDGKWIYFGSNQSGEWQIWKTTPQGGPPIQVTRHGAREAFEAPDGGFLYYTKAPPEFGIWRITLSGAGASDGTEEKVADYGTQGHWAVGGRGIYYLNRSDELMFQSFSGTSSTPIPTPGLQLNQSASNMIGSAPDDRWVLLSIVVRSEQRLRLVRNFR